MRGLKLLGMLCAFAFLFQAPVGAEGRPFIGVDAGVSEPTNANYRAHAHTGWMLNPYFGYMFNDYLGLQGQIHFSYQENDNDHRGPQVNPWEHEDPILFGGTVGPRLDIPLSDVVTLYGTGQGGYFTGLHGALRTSAPGFSVGGGIDFNITRNIALSAFGRWNRAYMSPRPTDLGPTQKASQRFGEDIRWATAGAGLKYTFRAPEEAPPPPPPPAPAPPPPPPPAPPVKKQIILRSVNFDFDKATLRPDAIPVLDEAVEVLKEAGDVTIVVEGHTDSVGTDEYNLGLSRRRAAAVRGYLVDHGIAADRISSEGFGESKPVASNDTRDGRAQNRRVELHVK